MVDTTEKQMITQEQLLNMKEGTPVSYGPYGKVQFVEVTNVNENSKPHSEPHVVMRDHKGNNKRVFMTLFMKYAKELAA
jgi:hypothetical protein